MRPRLLACVALTLALAACTNVKHCSPCGGVGHIDLRPISAGVTGVRICLDGQCGRLESMATPPKESLLLGSEIYDASNITLQLYSGKKLLESYSGPLDVQRPKPEQGCGQCDSVTLVPADDNTLVRVS